MQNFPIHGNGNGLGRFNRSLQIVFADFPAFDGDNPQRVLPLNMAAGDTDIGGIDAAAGHVFGILHGLFDRLDGAVDIDHTAFSQFFGRGYPHTDDVNTGFRHFADNCRRFRRSNIDSHQNVTFSPHSFTLLE